MATYMREHRDQVRSYETVYSHLVKRARRRASEMGQELSLTVDFAKSAYPADGLCPVCKTEMAWNRGGKFGASNSPSFDRIDNSQGYIFVNTHVVCVACNSQKRDLTIEELAEGLAGEHWHAWAVSYLGPEIGAEAPRRQAPSHGLIAGTIGS